MGASITWRIPARRAQNDLHTIDMTFDPIADFPRAANALVWRAHVIVRFV
jgi:hypothetical protein